MGHSRRKSRAIFFPPGIPVVRILRKAGDRRPKWFSVAPCGRLAFFQLFAFGLEQLVLVDFVRNKNAFLRSGTRYRLQRSCGSVGRLWVFQTRNKKRNVHRIAEQSQGSETVFAARLSREFGQRSERRATAGDG